MTHPLNPNSKITRQNDTLQSQIPERFEKRLNYLRRQFKTLPTSTSNETLSTPRLRYFISNFVPENSSLQNNKVVPL